MKNELAMDLLALLVTNALTEVPNNGLAKTHLKANLDDKNGAWHAYKLADDYEPASGLKF